MCYIQPAVQSLSGGAAMRRRALCLEDVCRTFTWKWNKQNQKQWWLQAFKKTNENTQEVINERFLNNYRQDKTTCEFSACVAAFNALSLCERQRMPKTRTLFCLVDIKKRSFFTSCVFWFESGTFRCLRHVRFRVLLYNLAVNNKWRERFGTHNNISIQPCREWQFAGTFSSNRMSASATLPYFAENYWENVHAELPCRDVVNRRFIYMYIIYDIYFLIIVF